MNGPRRHSKYTLTIRRFPVSDKLPISNYSGFGKLLFSRTLYFFRHTNELRNFALTTQQRKFFICSFEYGLLLVLQDSWCLGLLVLETELLSGMLRRLRVAGRVRDVFKGTV